MTRVDNRRNGRGSVFWGTALGALCLLGCGASSAGGVEGEPEATGEAPAELVLGGRRYVRVSALSDAELAAMKDPALWQGPATVEKLAQLVRSWISHEEYGDYVEAEPNRELARISLGLDPSPFGVRGGNEPLPNEGLVEKTITANGDQRTIATVTNGNPGNAYAMNEAGGTGTRVAGRIYTAAHVVYRNAVVGSPLGWLCRNQTTSPIGAEHCFSAGNPRWRFGGKITVSGGVETQTWATSSWIVCGYKKVPNGWVNAPADMAKTTLARWDYALSNLDSCIPAGAGSVGWWTIDQATLQWLTTYQGGYPYRMPCQAGSVGAEGYCWGPIQLRSNPPGLKYWTGGSLFWTSGGAADPNLVLRDGYIQSSKLDTTTGQSGGSLIALDGGAWWSVGAVSNSTDGTFFTNYNALTPEVVNFLFQ